MIRKGTQLPHTNLNIVFNQGGLGDLIARLVAIKYVFDTYKHVTIHLWLQEYGVEIARNVLPKSNRLRIYGVDEKHKYNKEYPAKVTDNDYHSNLACHMVDHAFHVIVDRMVEDKYKNYLQLDLNNIDIGKFNLPEKYVVITSLFTSKTREMIPEALEGISKYVLEKGYTPVFLGKSEAYAGVGVDPLKGSDPGANYSIGMDLRDKTTLLEAAKVIAGSKCIVGLDNGLLHLAGMTDATIVAGFTTVKPEHRLPYRHDIMGYNCYSVVPDESLACKFCQSNFEYLYEHSFTKCFYKDYLCVKQLTSDKYIKQLEKIL